MSQDASSFEPRSDPDGHVPNRRRFSLRLVLALAVAAMLILTYAWCFAQFFHARHIHQLIDDLTSTDEAGSLAAEDKLTKLDNPRDIDIVVDALAIGLLEGGQHCGDARLMRVVAGMDVAAVPSLMDNMRTPGWFRTSWSKEFEEEIKLDRVSAVTETVMLLSKKAGDVMLPYLGSPHTDQRYAAIAYFCVQPDPRACDGLIAALQDKKRKNSDLAAIALGSTRESRAVDPLISYFQRTNYMFTIASLDAIGTPKARELVDSVIPPAEVAKVAEDLRGNFLQELKSNRFHVTYLLAVNRYMTLDAAVDMSDGLSRRLLIWWAQNKGVEDELLHAMDTRHKTFGPEAPSSPPLESSGVELTATSR